jgi:hypothetical protein
MCVGQHCPVSETTPQRRLYEAIERRVSELGWSWERLADETGLTSAYFREMRRREHKIRPGTKRQIEQGPPEGGGIGLGWARFSCDRVLAGGEPEIQPGWGTGQPPPDPHRDALEMLRGQLGDTDMDESLARYGADPPDEWIRDLAATLADDVLAAGVQGAPQELYFTVAANAIRTVLSQQRALDYQKRREAQHLADLGRRIRSGT